MSGQVGVACDRCGTDVERGFCIDETCPFSSHLQLCPVGWHGHPERDNEYPCRCAIYAPAEAETP